LFSGDRICTARWDSPQCKDAPWYHCYPAALLIIARQTPYRKPGALHGRKCIECTLRNMCGETDAFNPAINILRLKRYSFTILFLSLLRIGSLRAPDLPHNGAQSITYWWIFKTVSQSSFGAQNTRPPSCHGICLGETIERNCPFQRSLTVAAAIWVPSYVSSAYTSS